jgi:hypothetical protein
VHPPLSSASLSIGTRRQQDRIVEIVEAFVAQFDRKAS